MHKPGDNIEFRGYTATILFVFADGLTKIAYTDADKAIHILHVRFI